MEPTKYSATPLAIQIRALRKKLGITQARMACRLDVSRRTVQSWEAGTVPNGAAMLRLLELEKGLN